MRNSTVNRKTGETDIKVNICLDVCEQGVIKSGCGFLDHMLTLFAKHANITLSVLCQGDTYVDYHHTTEDIGIALGEALKNALGDKRGISRYSDIILPMDEALILAAMDISGRGMLCFDMDIPAEKVGDFDTELAEEFFRAFANNAGITLHIRKLAGKNSHHIIEGAFKAVARCVRGSVKIDAEVKDEIPSTKGVL
ncbi:MAG: imidazoleglycerol-phosphate dehydratase HisB [Clostridia bacterium]|nr:imidazoleglycerol-phosphate dehydratase HisB [Clostridia bacterium]MBQ6937968.1 imidazoleglycerol-phosphate dehydratase HisB [Clostridia bacterium]MBR2884507.1 imidazoleglycerol-phosphate dehydratase HisB [Clostridia bacterium]